MPLRRPRGPLAGSVAGLQVFANEPALQLIGAHHLADDEVVRALVTTLGGLARERAGFFQYDFVRVEQSTQLIGRTLA